VILPQEKWKGELLTMPERHTDEYGRR